jgi:hypothetical protein
MCVPSLVPTLLNDRNKINAGEHEMANKVINYQVRSNKAEHQTRSTRSNMGIIHEE